MAAAEPLIASAAQSAPTGDDGGTRTFHVGNLEENRKVYPGNRVVTSKYSFIPLMPNFIIWRNLYEQFHRYANIYFMFIALLQLVPGLSPTGRFSTLGPLTLVMTAQLVKDLYEDLKRHLRDREVNQQKVLVWTGGQWQNIAWENVRVGDVVEVDHEGGCGGRFPADLLLVWSSEAEGMCHIETSNLDGETNLKLKTMHKDKAGTSFDRDRPGDYSATIRCELPNRNLYKFEGQLMREGVSSPIVVDSVLLRGSAMGYGTKRVIGVVIYTGKQTKLMMNQQMTRSKASRLEQAANRFVVFIFGLLAVMVTGCAIALGVHTAGQSGDFYLAPWELDPSFEFLRGLGTFVILFNNLIPISLYVSMEMCKIGQALFMNMDIEMYHEETDTPTDAKSSSLNEELGQIQYIFSDKTGTLTCNVMDFFRFSVGPVSYGAGVTEIGRARAAREGKPLLGPPESPRASVPKGFSFEDARISKDGSGDWAWMRQDNRAEIARFLKVLAVCHTVISEEGADGELVYQAASPDEGCLVQGARMLGMKFLDRDLRTVTIEVAGPGGERTPERWQLLDVLAFTSARKRMSVVVRDPGGKLLLLCKGADNVIFELLRGSPSEEERLAREASTKFLVDFASDGLRTLCIAQADVDEEFYRSWAPRFKEANESIGDRAERVAAVSAELERDLVLIGTTAIEDKLQSKVPETIELLRAAGINIWVLTGDKQETAINIGFACGLLNSHMQCYTFDSTEGGDATTTRQIRYSLQDADQKIASGRELSMVVEGSVLTGITAPEAPQQNRELFLELAEKCRSVVCCRVSPAQKAEVVNLVKTGLGSGGGTTLSIGDGANDVAMINEAHVGVGISGLEGLQAARSADYAIAQFRFLGRLLLVHGRWSYRRVVKVVLYSFYKNAVLYVTQFWFCFVNASTGQSLFDVWAIAAFNIIFTALPVLAVGMLDRDIRQERVMSTDQFPELYATGREGTMFNRKTFSVVMFEGFCQSAVCFFVPLLCQRMSVREDEGWAIGLNWVGMTCYTAVVWIATMKITLMATSFTVVHLTVTLLSLASWYLFIIVYGEIWAPSLFGTAWYRLYQAVLVDPTHWLTVFLCIPIACAREFLWKFVKRNYRPGLLEEIQGRDGRVDCCDYKGCGRADIKRAELQHLLPDMADLGLPKREHTREMTAISDDQKMPRVISRDLEKHTGYAESNTEASGMLRFASAVAVAKAGRGRSASPTSGGGWKGWFGGMVGGDGSSSPPKSPVRLTPSLGPSRASAAPSTPAIAVAM